MITAVYKKTTNLKLHFFSNDSAIANMNRDESSSCQRDDEVDSGGSEHCEEESEQKRHQGDTKGRHRKDSYHRHTNGHDEEGCKQKGCHHE